MNIEWGKLGILMTTLLGCFLSVIFKVAVWSDVLPVITGAMGYVYGNGRLASRGETSVPLIAPSADASVDTLAQKLRDKLLGGS